MKVQELSDFTDMNVRSSTLGLNKYVKILNIRLKHENDPLKNIKLTI